MKFISISNSNCIQINTNLNIRMLWKCGQILTLVLVIMMPRVEESLFGVSDGLKISRKYSDADLKAWRAPEPISETPGAPGEMGRPVKLSKKNQEAVISRFAEHEFNIVASELISLHRSLADVRDPRCKQRRYHKKLPDTSIIIVFHNEALSTLLRTVWSAINRSPRTLLKEFILVDDASEKEYLGKELDDRVKELPVPTYVLRTGNRTGLIRSRLLGAEKATGQVLTFLDAHCECLDGWLEPLLSRIVDDRTTVPNPTIDIINDETFEYKRTSDGLIGGFDWNVGFRWKPLSNREKRRRSSPVAPYRSPTMAGGLFAIDREFFYEVGSYDEGMEIWGSENVEMSFRVWMCGGTVEIIPCSRVGHIFRKKSPYVFPGDTASILSKNTGRLVEVWVDDYKHIFRKMFPDAQPGDVSARVKLRSDLKCKSFQWYIDNVYPECNLPKDFLHLGQIKRLNTNECVDTMRRGAEHPTEIMACHNMGGAQIFIYNKHREIRQEDLCLDAPAFNERVMVYHCHGSKGNQEWDYDEATNVIKHVQTGYCLTRTNRGVEIHMCNESDRQQWTIG